MRRRSSFNKNFVNNEAANLNLSSFIDILFVLLIVFMVPSQLIFGNIKLNLPSADAEIVVLEKDPIKIFIDQNAAIVIDDVKIKFNELVRKVNEVSLKNKNVKIYVVADKENNYGFVLNVVGRLNESGFTDVVLITDVYGRI